MAAEPSSGRAAKAGDWLTAHLITWFMAGLVIALWFGPGPDNPAYGLVVTGWTLNLGLVVIPLALSLPERWFHVPAGERALHRVLGVAAFGWLLDKSGWNRAVALPFRNLKVDRGSLPRLHFNMRAAAGAHGIAFVPHVLLAALSLLTGYPSGALWILLPGVFAHLYPVLLQRSMMLRLQPMLARTTAATDGAN